MKAVINQSINQSIGLFMGGYYSHVEGGEFISSRTQGLDRVMIDSGFRLTADRLRN